MPRRPVFTPQDISVFRRAIDTYRAPGAYEPGKWSVSPLNRRLEIVGSPFLPRLSGASGYTTR